MISAVPKPKGKYHQRKGLRPQPSARNHLRRLLQTGFATMLAVAVLASATSILGRWLGKISYLKTQCYKEYMLLQQKSVSLQNEIELITSALALEDLAKKTNMNQPTKVYYLRLGKL